MKSTLTLAAPAYYRVKRGETLSSVAETYRLPPRFLAAENGLTEELFEGQIVRIPKGEGNLYTVRGGESKTLLCGSPAAFEQKNGPRLYIGQRVFL